MLSLTPPRHTSTLRTEVVPCAVLATCHVKPMLTLAGGLEAKQESRRKKILKAPLSPQLRIFGRNEDGRRGNSENSSAAGKPGGPSQICESSVARPLELEAAAPGGGNRGRAPGEGSLAAGPPRMKAKRGR